jgi:hypothetical protein
MKRKIRGEFDSHISKEDGLMVVKWIDNNIISAASTCHGVAAIANVQRYSQD